MQANKIITYYIGLNDKDKKVQIYNTETCKLIIKGCLKRYAVDGYTMSLVEGCYKNSTENTIKIELFNEQLTSDCIIDLEQVLNQECIAEVVTNCTINFI